MIEVTVDSFDAEVMQSDVPVLLDFWAPWCGPCKMMTPMLEELSEQFSGQIKFCKANIEEVPTSSLPEDFSVGAVPTILMIIDGEVAGREVGLKGKGVIQDLISGVL